MSTTENLAIVINAEVTQPIRGLDSLGAGLARVGGQVVSFRTQLAGGTTALTTFANGATTTAASVGKLAPPLTQFTGSLQVFVAQARQGQLSFTGLANGAVNAGRAVTAAGSQISRGGGAAAVSLQNLGRVASDAPFGFIAIQNNLDPLIDSFSRLSTANGGLGGAFKALGASLAGPAGIALAFTLVSSTVTVLIQKYGSLGNAFAALNPFISEAGRQQVAFSNAAKQGGEAAQEELVHVSLLYKASQDLNVPLADRKRIVDQLQQQYPQTFKGLSDEAILAGGAAKAYDQLTKSLLATATVKATEGLLVEQQKKLFDLTLEAQDIQKIYDNINKGNGSGLIGIASASAKTTALAQVQARLNDNKAKQLEIDAQTKTIQEAQLSLIRKYGATAAGISSAGFKDTATVLQTLNQGLADVNTKTKLLGSTAKDDAAQKVALLKTALSDLLDLGLKPTSTEVQSVAAQLRQLAPVAATKNVKTVSEIVQQLQKDLKGLDVAFLGVGTSVQGLVQVEGPGLPGITTQIRNLGGDMKQLNIDKINKIAAALKDLGEVGVKPGDKIFNDLSTQVDFFQTILNKTPVTLKIAPTIDTKSATAAKNTAAIDAVTKGIKMKFRDGMVDVSKIVNDALKGGAADGISTIVEGLGTAIGGGGLKSALGGFITAIASFGQSLGKQLIAQGIALTAFNASLKTLNGPTAIIAGAALIAASAAFRSLAGKGVSAFATGGTVFGPQLAMIGDNPGREEHIIPSEVLDKMNGGAGGTLEARFSVNEMIIWLNRGKRSNA